MVSGFYVFVTRTDMKRGFCFVFLDTDEDLNTLVRELDKKEFGRERRPLKVELTRGDGAVKRYNAELEKLIFQARR